MNIVLVGHRCSGKTTVGKILAHRMDRDFIDTDEMIEEIMGCPISSIVAEHGWGYFRGVEKRVIREISRGNNLVVATGGGVVLDVENVDNLKRNGSLIWLNGRSAAMRQRFKEQIGSGRSRPSLTGRDPMEEFDRVMEERKPLYENAANYVVDTSVLTPSEVAESIVKYLKSEEKD